MACSTPSSRATTGSRRRAGASTISATASSRRTLILGPSLWSRRSRAAQTWSSPAGSAIRLCSWARLCTSSAGGWTTGTRSGAGRPWATCLNAPDRSRGGYFADPGYKDVQGLARLGFPIGEVSEDGSVVVTKVPGSGGQVTLATSTEQLLYEVHDSARYFQPDVVADFSEITMSEAGPDRVRVEGGRGAPKTGSLKVSIGYIDSYVGEGQISYAGPGALARGRLALEIVRERLALTGVATPETRFDLIGVDALHGEKLSAGREPYEVRVRVAGRTDSLAEAVRIGNEVETLYTNGPAGGGGATKSAKEVVAVVSALLPADLTTPIVHYLEV